MTTDNIFTLVTTSNNVAIPERVEELKQCAQKNSALSCVKNILVLYQGESRNSFYRAIPKLVVREVSDRPTYGDLLLCAQEIADTNGIVVITNADIEFDDTLSACANIGSAEMYAITRVNSDGKLQGEGVNGSHDAWVARQDISIGIEAGAIQIGINGCDSYFNQKLQESGIKVTNPCLSVTAKHIHAIVGGSVPPAWNYWSKPDYAYTCIKPCAIG